MSYDQVRDVAELLRLPVEDRPRRIAEHVHRIQVDKSGRPYIDHPRRVAENVQFMPAYENLSPAEQADAVAAAWLHDVIEDSGDDAWPPVMPEDLLRWGISLEVVEIVLLLTRTQGDKDKDAYYLGINANPLARLVKIADVADNCNQQRILWVEDAGGKRDQQRYAHALEVLNLSQSERLWFDSRTTLPAELELNSKREENHD